jgi:hypothetical protein
MQWRAGGPCLHGEDEGSRVGRCVRVAADELVERGERGRALQQRRLHAVREAERGGVRRHRLAGREREEHLAGAAPVGGGACGATLPRAGHALHALSFARKPAPALKGMAPGCAAARTGCAAEEGCSSRARTHGACSRERWSVAPSLQRTWGARGCPRGAPRCSRSFAASAVTATLRISPERAARACAARPLKQGDWCRDGLLQAESINLNE